MLYNRTRQFNNGRRSYFVVDVYKRQTLFNSESADAAVKSVNYTSGGETLGVDAAGYTVPASGSLLSLIHI